MNATTTTTARPTRYWQGGRHEIALDLPSLFIDEKLVVTFQIDNAGSPTSTPAMIDVVHCHIGGLYTGCGIDLRKVEAAVSRRVRLNKERFSI